MTKANKPPFRAKHPEDAVFDPVIRSEIEKHLKEKDDLPCAVAFAVAKEAGRTPEEVGRTADLLGVRLSKCQLGLFGYMPEKKRVAPAKHVDATLEQAISEALQEGRLPCKAAWKIAEGLGVSKMSVSAACEALKIKVSACQLGAF